MSRLEIIHLRLSQDHLEDRVQGILQSVAKQEGPTELLIYRRERVPTDLSIHLVHRRTFEKLPSELGVRLASALREHGMVEHSIWAEASERSTA